MPTKSNSRSSINYFYQINFYTVAKFYSSVFLLGCSITVYFSIGNSLGKYHTENIFRRDLYDEYDNDLVHNLQKLETKHILNTPFYVYEELIFKDGTFTLDKEGKTKITFDAFFDEYYLNYMTKHSDDYWFMQSALNHPMRVKDPKEAKLFYVPSLMNLIATVILNPKLSVSFCHKKMCDEELLKIIDNSLGESEWFQRNNGADHIIVASHYGYNTLWDVSSKSNDKSTNFTIKVSKEYRNIYKCNKIISENISQETINHDRINFPSMYVGTPCTMKKLQEHKKYRFVFLRSISRFDPSKYSNVQPNDIYDPGVNICKWLKNSQPTNNYKDLCGEYKMCPNIKFAKYGFHLKDDSFGSRPIDLIMNGVVPVFTSKDQYDILPQWIPWRDLSYFAELSSETSFRKSIHKISSDEQGYKIKHRAIMEFRELFDYANGSPFDMYMYNFAKHIERKKLWRHLV